MHARALDGHRGHPVSIWSFCIMGARSCGASAPSRRGRDAVTPEPTSLGLCGACAHGRRGAILPEPASAGFCGGRLVADAALAWRFNATIRRAHPPSKNPFQRVSPLPPSRRCDGREAEPSAVGADHRQVVLERHAGRDGVARAQDVPTTAQARLDALEGVAAQAHRAGTVPFCLSPLQRASAAAALWRTPL